MSRPPAPWSPRPAANLDQNGRDLARQQRLLATGSSIHRGRREAADHRARSSPAQLAQNRAQADAAGAQLGVLAAQAAQAEAALAAQQASAASWPSINLGYTRIVAPEDGVLGQRQVQPGPVRRRRRPGHHPDAAAATSG